MNRAVPVVIGVCVVALVTGCGSTTPLSKPSTGPGSTPVVTAAGVPVYEGDVDAEGVPVAPDPVVVRGAPIRIPSFQQVGTPLSDMLESVQQNVEELCGGELCLEVVTVPPEAPECYTWGGVLEPSSGTVVDRGETLAVVGSDLSCPTDPVSTGTESDVVDDEGSATDKDAIDKDAIDEDASDTTLEQVPDSGTVDG